MRLHRPTNWKEVARVIYSDSQVLNVPFLTTASEPSFASGTRGTAYTPTDFTMTNDTLTITTYRVVSQFIDRADLAQFKLYQAAEAGELQGRKISEGLEAAMLADHAAWTNFGDTGGGVLGLSATAITVSATNIDDIVRGVIREIVKANGLDVMKDKGVFFVWKPAEFEFLTQFAQANGYQVADEALKNGLSTGVFVLGAWHYQSNDNVALHTFAGVKGLYTIGILKSTWGQVTINQDPPSTGAGAVSGISVVTRCDYGLLTPTKYKPVLFDINTTV